MSTASTAAATRATKAASIARYPLFVPRSTFEMSRDLPKSYFIGHHKAGLEKMKTMLSRIDLVIECRDYRIPETSRNPLLEESLKARERIVVYTKWDLGSEHLAETLRYDETLRAMHAPIPVHFVATPRRHLNTSHSDSSTRDRNSVPLSKTVKPILKQLKEFARSHFSLTGHRVLVAGMPNVGKSTLLNALRAQGVRKGKAARTGAQPGITRSIASSVKILRGEDIDGTDSTGSRASLSVSSRLDHNDSETGLRAADSEGVFVVDTPGVFMPYVPDGEAMLKLALCGCVRDGLLPPILVADYLLFQLNLHNPGAYADFSSPTNDIGVLLEGVARRTNRLSRRSGLDLEAAAQWIVQRWRKGTLGRFILDEIKPRESRDSQDTALQAEKQKELSMNQIRKLQREARRERSRERYQNKMP